MKSALDLTRGPTSPISSKKVSLEGSISVVRLIELDTDDVEVIDNSVHWPDTIGTQATPVVDGALVLYSVLDQYSITPLPALLNALSNDATPAVVVASNADHPSKSWRVSLKNIEKLCSEFKGVDSVQTSISAPDSHKRCVSIMLRNIMLDKQGGPCKPKRSRRPRALTSSQPASPQKSSNRARLSGKHLRGASNAQDDLPRLVTTLSLVSDTSASSSRLASPQMSQILPPMSDDSIEGQFSPYVDNAVQESSDEKEPETPDTVPRDSNRANITHNIPIRSSVSDTRPPSTLRAESSPTIDEQTNATPDSPDVDSPPTLEIRGLGDEETKESGVSFEELLDRLISQPMSKTDSKFVATFLCLYRKFAAPSELLLGIIQRFEDFNDNYMPHLLQLNSQLRCLRVLRDFVADYPGDFAHPFTRRIITNFVHGLALSPAFAVAHKEIAPHLDVVQDDDDTEWAYSDQSRSRASTMESFLSISSAHSAASTVTADSSTEDIVDDLMGDKAARSLSTSVSATHSTSSSVDQFASQSTTSFQQMLNTVENARSAARLLTPIPRSPLDKIRWRQMMDIPNDQIADELTRIDWILYSAIRPRDLIRHISLSADQKARCKSLQHVNRMINQFNHVAFWVANMILLRDKPKHRAQALEKFMGVAWSVRKMNNYNSLGAIIAGINGTAVHRLAQTRELIPREVGKQFMRLEILMGTTKSHAAYRMGWSNTSKPRIPFLPLHRRDLVLAEEGNRTFIPGPDGDRINWKKFEVMGDVIVEIRKSQELPYQTIKENKAVQRQVLDGKFCKDDEVSSRLSACEALLSLRAPCAIPYICRS